MIPKDFFTRNQELEHTNIYTGSLIEPGFSFRLFGLEYRWNPATRGGCRHDRESPKLCSLVHLMSLYLVIGYRASQQPVRLEQ